MNESGRKNVLEILGGAGRGLFTLAAGLSLAACAGTRVNDLTALPSPISAAAPHTVQVQVVDGETAEQLSARHAGTPADEAQAVAGLSASLTALLSERGLAAAPAGESPDLILRCVVTDARSGSKLKRIVIGLGAGQARLQLQVSLIEPRINQQPILSFETASTTGSSPGAAIPIGPGGAVGAVGGAYGLYKGSKQGLPLEEQQTQKKIDGQLKTYFAAQGWVYREPALTAAAR